MTADGHVYARFRRALDRGHPLHALAAAGELKTIGLRDSLELLLLLRHDSRRFDKAAVRWTAKYVSEVGAPLEEAQAVLALIAASRGPRASSALRALAELMDRRGLEQAAEALIRTALAEVPRP